MRIAENPDYTHVSEAQWSEDAKTHETETFRDDTTESTDTTRWASTTAAPISLRSNTLSRFQTTHKYIAAHM